MSFVKTNPYYSNKKSKKKKKNNHRINDYHYRFDGNHKGNKVSKPKITESYPEDIHNAAEKVFGKTYYISVNEH